MELPHDKEFAQLIREWAYRIWRKGVFRKATEFLAKSRRKRYYDSSFPNCLASAFNVSVAPEFPKWGTSQPGTAAERRDARTTSGRNRDSNNPSQTQDINKNSET
jgi:hypothetical protein